MLKNAVMTSESTSKSPDVFSETFQHLVAWPITKKSSKSILRWCGLGLWWLVLEIVTGKPAGYVDTPSVEKLPSHLLWKKSRKIWYDPLNLQCSKELDSVWNISIKHWSSRLKDLSSRNMFSKTNIAKSDCFGSVSFVKIRVVEG